MKKFLSVLLTVLMIAGLCIAGVSASEVKPASPEDACTVFGDVDVDNTIDAADARLILRASVGLEKLDEKQTAKGDMDLDGILEAGDARFILRLSVDLEKTPSHAEVKDEAKAATFAVSGLTEGSHCGICDTVFAEQKKVESTLETAAAAANTWAEESGADAFVSVTADDNKAGIILNVDGIWAEDNAIETSVFDGLLTKLGETVKAYLGENDTVTIDGNVVFAEGKLQNTAVKSALFDMGAGFFCKTANLAADGVFGVYDVKVNDEEIKLTVSFAGSEENIGKVKNFCAVISEHISAEAVDGNLVIDVIAPEALKNAIVEKAGEDAAEKLNAMPVGTGLGIIAELDAAEVFGSEASAVNKLCAFVCELSPFFNKVLAKTEAYVELADGTMIKLNANEFDCGGDTGFGGFVTGLQGVLSDELLETTVGAFLQEDGTYQLPVHLSVDMSSLGLMAGETITETVYVNVHLW